MKSFRRSLKAISPIFATLILIAIAVIAGVVVYMFTSGTLSSMTGAGTAGQEKLAIQAVQVGQTTGTIDKLTVYAQAQGNPVTLSNVILKDAGGNVVKTYDAAVMTNGDATNNDIVKTSLTSMVVTVAEADFPASGTYTVTLVGVGSGSFVSPSFSVAK